MKAYLTTAALIAALSGTAMAQATTSLPRGITQVNDNPSPTGSIGWRWWKTASPNEKLAGSNPNLPTAELVYLIYSDTQNSTKIEQLEFRRSHDGGLTWTNPQVLHLAQLTEKFATEGARLVCRNNDVFVFFRSNAQDTSKGDNLTVQCYGSQDQGRTWKGPLNCSPAFAGTTPTLKHDNVNPSRAKFQAAIGVSPNGASRAHVTFEAVQVSGTSNNEDLYYSAVEFDQSGNLTLAQSDVLISNSNVNTIDVDQPKIDSDGVLVAIAWLDDRNGAGNSANKTFVRVSRTGGNAFDAEFDASNVTTTVSADEPQVAVAGGAVYVFYGDARVSPGDDIYLTYSKDAGTNWITTDANNNPILINKVVGSDVDNFRVAADGPRVAIGYRDDETNGNSRNQLFLAVDDQQGDGFRAGTVTPTNVSALAGSANTDDIEEMDLKGQYLAVISEQSGDRMILTWSADGGKTFRALEHTPQPDSDDPAGSVSLNGDAVTAWIQDFGGSNTGNVTGVSGVKMPTLIDNTGNNGGIILEDAQQSAGKVAVLLMSLTGSATPIVLNATGFEVNLTQDAATLFALNLPSVFVSTVDAQGVANFPLVPNFAKQFNVDVYYAAVTIDAAASDPWLQFSDPLLQAK